MTNKQLAEKYIAKFVAYSATLLFFIIVLPNTIALRNTLLFLGGIFSLYLIKSNSLFFHEDKSRLALLAFPTFIFFWVIFHYQFFSLNPLDQWHEIKSLWMRSFLACFFGLGLAISISKYQELNKLLPFIFFSVPFINIIAYFYFSLQSGGFMPPASFLRYIFTKIEGTYYGSLACAFLCAYFFEFQRSGRGNDKKKDLTLLGLGLAVILVSNIITDTRNGALIWLSSCGVMLLYSLWLACFSVKKNIIINLMAVIVLLVFMTSWLCLNNRISQRTWDSGFIADVRAGLDIRSNPQWLRGEGAVPLPLNSKGDPVNSSTYHRVAWAVAGIHLIAEHPFGYGVIKNSFTGLLDVSGVSHGGLGQTHSGWVDFGLAYGFPGVLLLLAWILSIVYIATKNIDGLNILAASIAIIYIPLMLIAETAWKEYLEAEFFMLIFASGLILMRANRN